MNVVLGSKAQHQVLVTQGSGISPVSGDGSRQDSLGSLLEGQQRIILPSSYMFQTGPTALCTHARAAIPRTHYPDPGTHQTHLSKISKSNRFALSPFLSL